MPAGERPLRTRKRIGIIGGSAPQPRHLQTAETMGRLIAESGCILVNGGMRGVMEASARGARSAGGVVIGILPGRTPDEANDQCDIAIATGLGYMRNAIIVLNADALVAIDGEFGTLSEIAYAQIFGKTVFGLDTWDIPGIVPVSTPQEAMDRLRTTLDL